MVDMRPVVGRDRNTWGEKLLGWIGTVIKPEGGIQESIIEDSGIATVEEVALKADQSDLIAIQSRIDPGSSLGSGGMIVGDGDGGPSVLAVGSPDQEISVNSVTGLLGWRDRRSLDIRDFGAIGDGVSHPLSERYATLSDAQEVYPFATALTNEIDWCALTAASQVAGATPRGGHWTMPAGTFMVHTTLHVPHIVVGSGEGTGSVIKASAAFPADTDVVRLGDGVTYAHGCRLERMEIDASSVAGSTCVSSDTIQERSGLIDVRCIKWRKSAVRFLDACDNYILRDLELWGHVISSENPVALDLIGTWKNNVSNITIDNAYGGAGEKLLAGIRASGQLHASEIHIEEAIDGILLTGTSTHARISSITSLDVTNTIRSVAGNLGRWSVTEVFASGHTASIKNDNLGHSISSGAVAFYMQDGGSVSYAWTTANQAGIPARFREIQIADGTPIKRRISVRPVLTWSSIPAGGKETKVITVTGASGGDDVTCGPPAGFQEDLVLARSLVTAADTVEITVYNPTAGAITPATGGFRVTVTGY